MDSSARILRDLRISPTVQQGGTQTIQQSIYLAHDNPCGANLLIFQEMGLTQIRYIDLKNYLDETLGAEQMRLLFEEVRVAGTDFINNPLDEQKQNKYLYKLGEWAYFGLANLPVPILEYPGYRIKFSVYDTSGCLIWDSNFPFLQIMSETAGIYYRNFLPLVSTPPLPSSTSLYKLCNTYQLMPYLDRTNGYVNATLFSDFVVNQLTLPESIMAVASLLVDSANTRTFGIPTYGFSARSNANGIGIGGIGYHCSQFINIRTTPDEQGNTTLIESIFARLSIEEDTLFVGTVPHTTLYTEEIRLRYKEIFEKIEQKKAQLQNENNNGSESGILEEFITKNHTGIFARSAAIQRVLSQMI